MALNQKEVRVDFCVVGGGIAGMFAAITAARLGVRVALIQERPVFGGNASGEVRMWICGAQQHAFREAGLQEELNLENYYFNSRKNWYLFDSVLYNKVYAEPNILPFLNCTCHAADCADGHIRSITAYQMTTQTEVTVFADCFADCSGDSILAPLCGADYMYGREGNAAYGEEATCTRTESDGKTMGNSVLIQARYVGHPVTFTAPDWAEKVSVEKLKSKGLNLSQPYENFWYIELGGNDDVIGNAETINHRLIALCLGVWDTVKNSGEFNAEMYDLDFLGFLPAKRESRRMTGDYVMTAADILDGGHFPDTVAYGGWGLDDHNPDGFDGDVSNHNTPLHAVYGIPYRCLYSRNIDNLFFAGRNISMTHMAMSSARVMGTCGTLGEAVGTAAYLCKKYTVLPRGVGAHMEEMQQTLLLHDSFLPGVSRKVSPVCRAAELVGDGIAHIERLRDGTDRQTDGEMHSTTIPNGGEVVYRFPHDTRVRGVKIVWDSDLTRDSFAGIGETEKYHSMRCNIQADSPVMPMPGTLCRAFSVFGVNGAGDVTVLYHTDRNLRRNLLIPLDGEYREIRLRTESNYGDSDHTHLFTFEIE